LYVFYKFNFLYILIYRKMNEVVFILLILIWKSRNGNNDKTKKPYIYFFWKTFNHLDNLYFCFFITESFVIGES
jgi:hypothetical protein